MTDPVIDISHWNEPVDFNSMRLAGVVGVIAKATEGSGYIDDTYADRKQQALNARLLWGAYHFLRPGDMRQQAAHFVQVAGDIDLYAADHEDSGVSLNDLKEFMAEVERLTGKKPILYSGHGIKEQIGSGCDDEMAEYRLWIAQYTSAAAPDWPEETWPEWWLWQYTESGSCPGVGGDVDCNRYDGTKRRLRREWTGEFVPPEPQPEPEPPAESEVTITISVEAVGAKVTVKADPID